MFDIFGFKIKKRCRHLNVDYRQPESYCPDCGELVKTEWYITRCKCCNIKREAILSGDNIFPSIKYCHNCGSQEFIIEKVENINFIDIDYAVLKREVVETSHDEKTVKQIWIEIPKWVSTQLLTGHSI